MQSEFQDERDLHGHVLAAAVFARTEEPLLRGLHRLFVETEEPIERLDDTHFVDSAVRCDDSFEPDLALDLGAHGLARVLRFGLEQRLGIADAVAGLVSAAAKPAARSLAHAVAAAGANAAAASPAAIRRQRHAVRARRLNER